MKKVLNYFRIKLKDFNSTNSIEIPEYVSNEEKVVRAIFEPSDIIKKTNSLKYVAFKSPPDIDEVSVTRLSYSTPSFCKQHAKTLSRQSSKYYGLAVVDVVTIRSDEIMGDVLSSPLDDNPAHADIKIGYTPIRGEQLPTNIRYRLDRLAEVARLYEDNNKDGELWISSLE